MRTRYQRAFDHVTASDRLKQEVLTMTRQDKEMLRRRIPKTALIAVLIILVLAGTAVAVSVPGLQDWFRQYWQEATGRTDMTQVQEDAIGKMTQSVDTSARPEGTEVGTPKAGGRPAAGHSTPAENDKPEEEPAAGGAESIPNGTGAIAEADKPAAEAGIAVTLESATVGEKHLWILLHVSGTFEPGKMYTFERSELIGAPEKVYTDLGIKIGKSLSFSRAGCQVLEDGSLQILAQYQSPDPNADLTAGGEFCLHLEDLLMERELVLKGEWDIPFSLQQAEPLPAIELEHVALPIPGLEHTDGIDFQEAQVTATGMELICDGRYAGFPLWTDVALVLTDGTEIGTSAAHASWEGEAEASRWVIDYTWKVPVTLEQAASIRIEDVFVPLK